MFLVKTLVKFLRIALVHKQDMVIEALQKISDYFKKNNYA